MAKRRGGKGLLSGNNLLWGALLAVGGYLVYTKVIQPSMGKKRGDKSPPPPPGYGTRHLASGGSVPVKMRQQQQGGPPPGMGMAGPSSGKPTMNMPPPANQPPMRMPMPNGPRPY